jgi:hypothetical protein
MRVLTISERPNDGTHRGSHFHQPTCPWLSRSLPYGLGAVELTEQEALRRDFTPCRHCREA